MTTLDELRRANLQEQHRSAGTQATPPLTIKEALGNTKEEEAVAKAAAAPEAIVPSSVPAVIETPAKAAAAQKSASQNGRSQPAEEAAKESDMVERVHQALVRKVIHPTGVKATVDMPPELFWRLKRYCRDHNNATLRQVFLDVMMAYLDEEGY